MADEFDLTTGYDEAEETDIEVVDAEADSEGMNPGLLLAIGAGAALAIREGAAFVWRKTEPWRASLKEKAEKEAKKAEKEAKKAAENKEEVKADEEPKEEAPKKTTKKK